MTVFNALVYIYIYIYIYIVMYGHPTAVCMIYCFVRNCGVTDSGWDPRPPAAPCLLYRPNMYRIESFRVHTGRCDMNIR